MKLIQSIITLYASVFFTACTGYLDEVPDPTLIIPNSISDLQGLLDNYPTMNRRFPYSMVVMSDNYYLRSEDLNSLNNSMLTNMYAWQPDDMYIVDWVSIYFGGIITANTVLDYMDQLHVNPGTPEERRNVRGSALFYRGFWHYVLAELYSQPYSQQNRNSEYGIHIRQTSDINVAVDRATVGETYDQIVKDLEEAASILPTTQTIISRPTRAAAFGILARVSLSMGNFTNAYHYADACIKETDARLMDFNALDASESAPIKRFNSEVIFQCLGQTTPILSNQNARIDSNLYDSYVKNDLRKIIYFTERPDGSAEFRGDYDGVGAFTGYAFGGLALDEIYFIRAEAAARLNNVNQAKADLNTVMESRWKTGEFKPFHADNTYETLRLIYHERRKELIFRGTRWSDLRRLQFDPDFSVTPKRIINELIVELRPGSYGYMLQIPASVINMAGIKQNPKDD